MEKWAANVLVAQWDIHSYLYVHTAYLHIQRSISGGKIMKYVPKKYIKASPYF